MSKFVKSLALFLSGLPMLLPRAAHAELLSDSGAQGLGEPDAVPLRPLNRDIDNVFAGHSSHSSHASHASHASHYSGSRGSGYSPDYGAPAPPPPAQGFVPTLPQPASLPAYMAPSARSTLSSPVASASEPTLSRNEKLKLQLMRVQIKLHSLGLYEGQIDGIRNAQTVEALKHFQAVKGLPDNGMMTTPTLNALGVPAVN